MTGQQKKPWTLFIDRDGVINKRPGHDYVRSPEAFHWINGSLEAMRILSGVFHRIILVTNQQGIGKGYMTEGDLKEIHQKMLAGINAAGGRIDGVYVAEGRRFNDSLMRKPASGMAFKAQFDFPEIDFSQSVMVGDTLTDMLFGAQLSMKNVLIAPGHQAKFGNYWPMIHYRFNSLLEFSLFAVRKIK